MKKVILSLLAVAALLFSACSSDKELVHITLADNALVLTPAPGGAVLHYALPNDPDIVGIHVRYTDCYGDPILRTGSSLSDSLKLVGFNEAQQNVPCQITMQLRNGDESAPIEKTFSTLDSDPIQTINSMHVESGWGGFSLDYKAPEDIKGMFHVFYLGENPYTHQEDTILLETKTFTAGGDTIIYQPQQLKEQNTIVVKVEDYRGHIVAQRQWDVESMQSGKSDGIKIFYDNSLEDDNEKVGLQYLTDGDTNGWRWWESQDAHKFYTFISKVNGTGEGSAPMYVDVGTVKPLAEVRLYAYLFRRSTNGGPCGEGIPCYGSTYCRFYETNIVGQELNSCYYNRLPCDVDVYGCREEQTSTDFDHMTWEKIGSYSDDPTITQQDYRLTQCWFKGCIDTRGYGDNDTSEDDTKALEPKYMAVKFMLSGQGKGFRYLKLVFNDNYRLNYEYSNGTNTRLKVLTFNELEVYGKK